MRNSLFFLALLALIVCATPVQAERGDAFPPDLTYSDSVTVNATACPSGKVMGWTGERVVCVNPSYGVSVDCDTGQFLAKITNGVPECIWPVDAVCPDKQVLTKLQNGSFACIAAGEGGGDLDIDCVQEGYALHKMLDGTETCILVTDNSSVTAECEDGKVLRGINKGEPVCVSSGGGSDPGGTAAWEADCGVGRTMSWFSFSGGKVWGIESNGFLGDNYCTPDYDPLNQKEWAHLEYWKYLGGYPNLKKPIGGIRYEAVVHTDGYPLHEAMWYGTGGAYIGSAREPACHANAGKTAACPAATVMVSLAFCDGNVAVRCRGYQ